MKKNKKIGMTIFLFLIGSLDARDGRLLTNVEHVTSIKNSESRGNKHTAKSERRSFNDAQFKSYQQSLSYGCMLYHKKSRVKFLDVVQAASTPAGLLSNAASTGYDMIEITKSKAAPQITYALSAVYENLPAIFKGVESVEASFGIQASIAKKDNAYQGTLKDAGVTVHPYRTRQNVKKYAVEVFGQYGLFQYYGWKYNIKLASGLSVGALRDLRVYELSNNILYNIGQRLIPNKSCATVEFGFNVEKEAGPLKLIFAYDFGYVHQTYKKYVVVDVPDSFASISHHNNYNLLKDDSVKRLLTLTPPVFNVWSYNFKLGAAFDF